MRPLLLRYRRLVLFGLLSALDLFLTWQLLERSGGLVEEGNPVAAWCLGQFGWSGLTALKVGSVLVGVGLLLAVARFRPQAAEQALRFGCLLLLGVATYSTALLGWVSTQREQAVAAEVARIDAEMSQMEQTSRRIGQRYFVYEQLCADLSSRRLSLDEAVQRLEQTDLPQQDARFQQSCAGLSGHSLRERLAQHLLHDSLCRGSHAEELACRLRAQFHRRFGYVPPDRESDRAY